MGQTASGFLTRSNKDGGPGKRACWGRCQVGEKNGKESEDRGAQDSEQREEEKKAEGEDGGGRGERRCPKDLQWRKRERAAVRSESQGQGTCLLGKFSQHFLGRFGVKRGHQVQQDSAESVRGRSGGIQAVGLQLPKGPERSWVCWRGRTGGS